MTVNEIIKSACRNLGVLSSDNESIIEGPITRVALLEELNIFYLNFLNQFTSARSSDDYLTECITYTYRDVFTVISVDTVNKTVTAPSPIFGNADEGFTLYNKDLSASVKMVKNINGLTMEVEGDIAAWTGDVCYLLTPIIPLKDEIEDFRSIADVYFDYGNQGHWQKGEKYSRENFISTNNPYSFDYKYSVGSIKINDVPTPSIFYTPVPTIYTGRIKIVYLERPLNLTHEDTPRLDRYGMSVVLINALTSWGFKIQNQFDKAAAFEENNPVMGGVVPRGMTYMSKKWSSSQNGLVKTSSLWGRRRISTRRTTNA
jgi:hypothetical protein